MWYSRASRTSGSRDSCLKFVASVTVSRPAVSFFDAAGDISRVGKVHRSIPYDGKLELTNEFHSRIHGVKVIAREAI